MITAEAFIKNCKIRFRIPVITKLSTTNTIHKWRRKLTCELLLPEFRPAVYSGIFGSVVIEVIPNVNRVSWSREEKRLKIKSGLAGYTLVLKNQKSCCSRLTVM